VGVTIYLAEDMEHWWPVWGELYVAESFLKTQYYLRQSRNTPHVMEREGSLTCSQQETSFLYSEPVESSPRHSTLFLEDSLKYYPTTTP
jgi:hypothetical protein